MIEETNSSGTAVARYSQRLNIDEPLAMLRSSTTSFHEADGLGTVTSLSNTSGALAETYTFDSFGKQTASSGSLTNPFQYTGREFDPETSLYYYRARYYDPAAGRFVSEDPAGFTAGTDFYEYVKNEPADFFDPYGLKCWVRIALITAYADRGPTSGQGGRPIMAGPGVIAEANRQNPLIYPFGCSVSVSSNPDPFGQPGPWPAYDGFIHDTGAGWDKKHRNVPPDLWFDIWLRTKAEANKWGKKWRQVRICCPDKEPCKPGPLDNYRFGGNGFDYPSTGWPTLSLSSGFKK